MHSSESASDTRADRIHSVEEGLRKYFHTETLDGDNQYSCEKCGKKCDATKVRHTLAHLRTLATFLTSACLRCLCRA